jgi:hypothetical protein
MNEILSQINITGTVDTSTTTEVYDLTLNIPFIDLLIFVILMTTAIFGFFFLIKLLWK